MKKDKRMSKDELRTEYNRSDFNGPMIRGKYAQRLREASNIVVLKPDVAVAFPNEEAVNKALQSSHSCCASYDEPDKTLKRSR